MRTHHSYLRQLTLLALATVTLSLFIISQDEYLNSLETNVSVPNGLSQMTPTPLRSDERRNFAGQAPTDSSITSDAAKTFQRRTDSRRKNWLQKLPEAVSLTPYFSVVMAPEQKNYIFKGKELLKTYTVSTGAGENQMPEAIWEIGRKLDSGLAEIYGPRLMFLEIWDNGQFKETTRAFHGTNEPEKIGANFGLGCVYHHNEDILELYDLLPSQTIVLTTYDSQPADWEILIGGTVVLSRGVDERIRKYNNLNYPWEKIAPLTRAADLTIINLKSPFVEDCPYVPDQPVFCAQDNYVKSLAFAGADLTSIAGNHLGDYGVEGIKHTLQVLTDNDILYTGAGKNQAEAFNPQIVELNKVNGRPLKIGFFSFNTVPGTSPDAGENTTGVAWWDKALTEVLVKDLKPQVNVLIAMPNWGPEYTHQPSAQQIEIGRQLIDWGVDVVAGDQAHWVQKYEEYNDGLIFYGLGNLIFDQMWSQKTREGLLLKLVVDENKSIGYELIPTILENYAQPRPATLEEASRILKHLN